MSNLGEIRQFHEQLRLLSSAGIKLDLAGDGKGFTNEQLSAALQRLEFLHEAERVPAQSSPGPTAAKRDHATPFPHYEIALQCWLRTAGSPESLAILVDSEVANSRLRTFRHLRLIHPFSWAFILGLSVLIFARFYAPKAVSLANNMGISAAWVDSLTAFRDSQGIWYVVVPVALLLFIVLIWRQASSRSLLASDYGQALVRTARVRQWSRLHAAIGQPREAWRLVAEPASPGLARNEPSAGVGSDTEFKTDEKQTRESATSNNSPPALVQWALEATEEATDEESAAEPCFARRLELVHDAYDTIEASHRFQLRNVMPRGPIVLIGGLAIAALGIAIFYPIVQMLLFVSGELGPAQ